MARALVDSDRLSVRVDGNHIATANRNVIRTYLSRRHRPPQSQMEKEFGKLTYDQFARLVSRLPEVRGQMHELPRLLREKKDRLSEILGESQYSWGWIYEKPFMEQMALLFILIGLHVPLLEAGQTADPQEAVLRWGEDNSPLDAWFEANKQQIEKKHLLWLGVVLQRNILSIMLYHKSMGALVDAVRNGDDSALFQAVRIDRTVLFAQPCADRLSRAELVKDKTFFFHLRSAIKGPTQKHMVAIQDLRYSIVALRECGFDRFSDQDLETLFIRTGLYPNSGGALKNLRKHIHAARKLTTT